MIEIKEYPNYLVSKEGDIINKKTNRKLKFGINKYGYSIISLYHNKVAKTLNLHRIVAENYINNINNKSQINHINGIKTDNRVSNLEWVSCSENLKHAFKNGLKSHNQLNLTNRRLSRIKLVLNTQTGIFYESATEAAKSINMSPSNLIQKLLGKRRNYTNFKYV